MITIWVFNVSVDQVIINLKTFNCSQSFYMFFIKDLNAYISDNM